MFSAIMNVKNMYDDMMIHSDPRTKDWLMVKSIVPTVCLCIAYVIFVKIIGPKMMENRKPYNLKTAMVVYNAIQALISLYLFYIAGMYGWLTRYSWVCQPPDFVHPDEEMILHVGWLFFLIRFLEFTDTVFFILRKKMQQVTTLHLVHHALVPIMFWFGIRFAPSGHYTLAPFLNAGVHAFMYTYYMLTALQHPLSGYKRYMTIMQLAQFLLVMVHTIQTLMSDCPVPRALGWLLLSQAVMFFGMFFSFYRSSFARKKSATAAAINTRTSKISTFKQFQKLTEMCIPNQEQLHHTTEYVQLNNKAGNSLQNGHSKKDGLSNGKLRMHSD